MKSIPIRCLILSAALLSFGSLAHAQFGRILKDAQDKVDKVNDKVKEFDMTEADEVRLGEQISAKVREKFGVVQDPEIHKYVALVGTALARNSTRSKLAWHFIVLDTDGVNAFAAPGGFVHITRGALAMMKSESDLAGVLGHELTHVTNKHTVHALQKNKGLQMGVNAANVPSNSAFFQKLVDEGTKLVLAGYGRAEELEADSDGVLLAGKTGYDPGGLRKFLGALNDRNNDSQAKQGLFASHPEMNERIQKLDAAAAAKQKSDASAVLADRFALHVKYQPVTLSQIPVVEDNEGKKDDKKKDDEKKPGKLSLSQLKNATGGGSETKQSASVTGSGGSRGVDRELTAKGGSNPAPVAVTITDTELAEFIRQGNLRG